MKTSLKFHFTSILLCFLFVVIFQCKCQNIITSMEVNQPPPDLVNASKPDVTKYETLSTTLATPSITNSSLPVTESTSTTLTNSIPLTSNSTPSTVPNSTLILENSTLPVVPNSTPILPNSTPSAVPSSSTESILKSDSCEKTLIFCSCFILFTAFVIVCICGLICVVYFLYLKKLEIKSMSCGCRIGQIDSSMNQTRGILLHDKHILDPATGKISFKRESKNSCGYRDSEIVTWDVYKYLELLTNKNQHLYEELKPSQEPVNDNFETFEASTSKALIHFK